MVADVGHRRQEEQRDEPCERNEGRDTRLYAHRHDQRGREKRASGKDRRRVRMPHPHGERPVGREGRRVERKVGIRQRAERDQPGSEPEQRREREVRPSPRRAALRVHEEEHCGERRQVDGVALEGPVGIARGHEARSQEDEKTERRQKDSCGPIRPPPEEQHETERRPRHDNEAGREGQQHAGRRRPPEHRADAVLELLRAPIRAERTASGREHDPAEDSEDGERKRVKAQRAPPASESGQRERDRQHGELRAGRDRQERDGDHRQRPAPRRLVEGAHHDRRRQEEDRVRK